MRNKDEWSSRLRPVTSLASDVTRTRTLLAEAQDAEEAPNGDAHWVRCFSKWYARQDLNLWPLAPQTNALSN